MELIRGFHNLRPRHRNSVVTVGAFDGVHYGHRAVLQQLIDKGKELGLPTTVVLFEPLPREFFAPKEAPARLMSFREKFRALEALGIDRVLRIHFTKAVSGIVAEEFVDKVLIGGLGARYMIVGDDLRFGRNRAGTFELLQSKGKQYGFDVVATSTFAIEGERVSSTRIRQSLADSDFALAEKLLGRPYSISGRVIVGQQLGRTIGIPTANLQLHRLRSPLTGVYAVSVKYQGCLLNGVANVGTRPTVDDSLKAILEVHVLDFSENIYGKNIEVIFHQKIRDEQQFESIEILKKQIDRDVQTARDYFCATNGE